MKKHIKWLYVFLAAFLAANIFLLIRNNRLAAMLSEANQPPQISPWEENGALSVKKSGLVNQNGEPFDLRGVSISIRNSEYVNEQAFQTLRDRWNVNTIRLCLLPEHPDGNSYTENGDRERMLEVIDQGIEYARKLGMYVIIDWHLLYTGNPQQFQTEAGEFFRILARRYADYGNILYEICNEPNGEEGTWENVKAYADILIPTIRAYDEHSIIILGTPSYCHDLTDVISDPIKAENIAYSYHFYAASHQWQERRHLRTALEAGLPVIVTEFGITEFSGFGRIDLLEANRWMVLLDQYHVGRVAFALNKGSETDEEHTCNMISGNSKNLWGWKDEELNAQGKWVVETFNHNEQFTAEDVGMESIKAETMNFPWVEASVRLNRSWADGGKVFSMYNVQLNRSSLENTDMTSWRIAIEAKGAFEMAECWNARYEVNGQQILLTPEDWNAVIQSDKTMEFGFVISGEETVFLQSVVIEAEDSKY